MSKEARGGGLTGTEEALDRFLRLVDPVQQVEMIDVDQADDRVLSGAVTSPADYPHYDQCIVDGYAVKAEDTTGCGERKSKVLLRSGDGPVRAGTCQVVHTGSALPEGADAVVMIEETTSSHDGIAIQKEAKNGDWIWPAGAGIRKGEVVFIEGRQLKPTDVAMLARLGIARVEVYRKPRVVIIPTGDEVIGRGGHLAPGTVYESNGLMCQMLVRRSGGEPVLTDVVPDDLGRLKEALIRGTDYDLIVTIGGSSGGKRDLLEHAVSSVGAVAVHGIAFHPGNHSGIGCVENGGKRTPVAFLPGYTESCAVAIFTLVEPAVRKLGRLPSHPSARSELVLTRDFSKPAQIRKVLKVRAADGKATPVKLIGEPDAPGEYAYLVIPEGVEGLRAGDKVEGRYLE
jgi:molybdopterin molybdotransferase